MIGVVKLTAEGVCSECGAECDAFPTRDEIEALWEVLKSLKETQNGK